jgi:hypothetical protein
MDQQRVDEPSTRGALDLAVVEYQQCRLVPQSVDHPYGRISTTPGWQAQPRSVDRLVRRAAVRADRHGIGTGGRCTGLASGSTCNAENLTFDPTAPPRLSAQPGRVRWIECQ